MDCPVRLSAELTIIHDLEEWMLLRWCDESRAALRIFPDDGEFSGKSRAHCCGLEDSIGVHVAAFRKRDQQCGSSDIQMGDGNRTI